MEYSTFAILALIILLVTNFNIIFSTKGIKYISALKELKVLIAIVSLFYISDALWGIFDYFHQLLTLEIVTFIYFALVAATLLCWLYYVARYLKKKTIFNNVLKTIGWVIFGSSIISIIVNVFFPIIYTFEGTSYVALPGRFIFFGVQLDVFLISSIYAFVEFFRKKYSSIKSRYLTIVLFGLLMAGAIVLQMFFPLQPFYSLGLLVSFILLHSFVISIERAQYEKELNMSIEKEKDKEEELEAVRLVAYSDQLTGCKSKHAYAEKEYLTDEDIHDKKVPQFAIAVFDLNDLKIINDKFGHDTGDKYLKESVQLIKKYFPDVDIYRYGGDEFVVFLEGDSYNNRNKMLDEFNKQVEANFAIYEPIVSCGLAEFDKDKDNSVRSVFGRADLNMYKRKELLKSLKGHYNN